MPEIRRIFDLLDHLPDLYPEGKEVFSCLQKGRFRKYDPQKYIGEAQKLACALHAAGVKKGDRIATLVANRPEWNVLDMGIMLAGAIQVPVYQTLGSGNFRFVFNDAAICLLFVDGPGTMLSVQPVLADIPSLREVISIDPMEGYRQLQHFIDSGDTASCLDTLMADASTMSPDEPATIIYTSGTTGKPKGVMLSHGNIVSNVVELSRIFRQNKMNFALSVLPLCHVYERVLSYTYQFNGTSIHYVSAIEDLKENLPLARPEIFCAVPRLLEKAYASIIQNGRNLKGFRKKLFFWAVEMGHEFNPGERSGLFQKIRFRIADQFVFRKIRQSFGGRLNTIVSGGASLNPKIARLFWAAGIKIMEGYGLTETSPVIAVGNFLKGGVKIGTVGQVLPGVEVSFAADGEILCKGPNVMLGYYNRPERTSQVIDRDGWFHTGDIGRMVDGKFLQITDRKKEMFKTSGGKYVAPQVLENRIKESPFIEFAMVVGENRNHPAAIIVPNFEYLKAWCRVKEIPFGSEKEIIVNERIKKRIAEEISFTNLLFSRPEQVKQFELVADHWSTESGELSPTLKLRRNFMLQRYATLIDRMYYDV